MTICRPWLFLVLTCTTKLKVLCLMLLLVRIKETTKARFLVMMDGFLHAVLDKMLTHKRHLFAAEDQHG